MGKTKQFPSSLRSKLTPRKSTPKDSPCSTATPSPRQRFSPFRWMRNGSTHTTYTDGSSPSGAGTPPTTPSKSPQGSPYGKGIANAVQQGDVVTENDVRADRWHLSAREMMETDIAMLDFAKKLPLEELTSIRRTSLSDKTTAEVAKSVETREKEDSTKENNIHTNRPYLNAHATMETNMAMLDFVKKLPLDELSMIGKVYDRSPKEVNNTRQARPKPPSSNCSGSTWSFVCHSPKETNNARQARLEQRLSNCSSSTWSFACQSARRVEREYNEQNADDASSFGSLNGWGVTADTAEDTATTSIERASHQEDTITTSLSQPLDLEAHPSPRSTTKCNMGVVSCAQVPSATSPKRSRPYSMVASILSPSADSFESCMRYLAVEMETKGDASRYPTMSDEEFDALPDWSDVEDDPAYNTFHRDSSPWSNTESLSSFSSAEDENTPVEPPVHAATNDMKYLAARSVGASALTWPSTAQKRKQGDTREDSRVAKRVKVNCWVCRRTNRDRRKAPRRRPFQMGVMPSTY